MTHGIHKAAGIIIRNRRMLVVRARDRDVYINPGGKLDPGETIEQALVREHKEELDITIDLAACRHIGTFRAPAATNPDKIVLLEAYLIGRYSGEIKKSGEIDELRWLASTDDLSDVASIIRHDILPYLRQHDLVD